MLCATVVYLRDDTVWFVCLFCHFCTLMRIDRTFALLFFLFFITVQVYECTENSIGLLFDRRIDGWTDACMDMRNLLMD